MRDRSSCKLVVTVIVCLSLAARAPGQECKFEDLSALGLGLAASHPGGIEREGNLLYATITTPEELWIFDVSVPEEPRLVSRSSLARSKDVAAIGSLAVLSGLRSVATIDTADPAAPRLLDKIPIPGEGLGVVIDGSVAFIADGDRGITAVDISDPAELRGLHVLDTPGRAVQLAVQDGVAYVADGEGGVRIIDVQDPTRMTEITSLTQWNAHAVAVAGDVLGVVTPRDGVALIDVSDPAAPAVLGTIVTRVRPVALALTDSVAWIATGQIILVEAEFLGVDIRDPAAPVEFGSVRFQWPFGFTGIYASDFAVSDHDAHIAVYLWESFRPLEVELHALDLSPCPPCPADCDASGVPNFFDFLCFQDLFAAGDPRADCDDSGQLDTFDFLCFQNAFAAGCP